MYRKNRITFKITPFKKIYLDRGSDNWMIKYCEKGENNCVINSPPKSNVMKAPEILPKDSSSSDRSNSKSSKLLNTPNDNENGLSSSFAHKQTKSSTIQYPHIHIAAIDNGLAFPFKHPDQWRSYPYGWSFLPEALIGQPFTTNTRKHFLKLLTDGKWWKETISELGRCFSQDADFDDGMFRRQIAVLKGQGWNIVETLKRPDQGPSDLIDRGRVMVWDVYEYIEVPVDSEGIDISNRASTAEDEDPAVRRSLSEDGSSLGGPSLSTSAPAVSSLSNASSSKSLQRWNERFNRVKEKFNLDNVGRKSRSADKRRVLVERLEKVKGRSPFFTWC